MQDIAIAQHDQDCPGDANYQRTDRQRHGAIYEGFGNLARPQPADEPAHNAHTQEQRGQFVNVPTVLIDPVDQQHEGQQHDNQDDFLLQGEGMLAFHFAMLRAFDPLHT